MQSTGTENELKHTLFVGDLSLFCDDDCLYSLFAPFGSVTNAQIRRGRRGDSLLYGFVEFANKDFAQVAMDSLDKRKFMGRTIRVRWADRNSESPDMKLNLVQVHVTFASPLSIPKVTEELLDIIFSSYGEVADCVVRRCVCDQATETQNGYGFVYFHSLEVAKNAVAAIQKTTINGVFFDCDISHRSGCTNNSTSKANASPLLIQPGIYSPITRPVYRPKSVTENQRSLPPATSSFLKTNDAALPTIHVPSQFNSQTESRIDTTPLNYSAQRQEIFVPNQQITHRNGLPLVQVGTVPPKGFWYPSELYHFPIGTPTYHHQSSPTFALPSHPMSGATDASINSVVHNGSTSTPSVSWVPNGIYGETQPIPAFGANFGAIPQGMQGVQYPYALSVPPYVPPSFSLPSSPIAPEYLQYPGYGSPRMIPTHFAYSPVYHTGEVQVSGPIQVAYVPDQHPLDPNRQTGK